MNILLLTTHLNTGGIGVYTVGLARNLKKQGVDVTVASSGGDLEGILAADGITHVRLNIRTKFEFGIKVARALPVVIRLVRDNNFQLIHAQTRVTQVLGNLAGKITGVPLVATCHGFFKHRRLSRRFFPCWGEKTIAISKSVHGHLLKDFRVQSDRVTLVYNGIELERFLSAAGTARDRDLMRDIGLADNVMTVGAIGRFSSVKGLKYLVSAFKKTLSRDECIQLVLVGEGPEKTALENQIRELDVMDKVFLVSPGDVPLEKYLSLFDIFCLPSVHAGLGLSLMEAMASGRACIASNVGGVSELITDEEDGILVPPKDPDRLSAAILRLAEDEPLRRRLAKNAREKASNNFSIINSASRTIKVYEQVLSFKL